jgi:hypothetical protein
MDVKRHPSLASRATETVFWRLLLAVHLPTAATPWLEARLLRLSDPFRAYAVALVRWRREHGG